MTNLSIGDFFGGMDPDIILCDDGRIKIVSDDEELASVCPDATVYYNIAGWCMDKLSEARQ